METLESSRVCRLCGKQSGISINIFDKNENHVKKINAILPVMVHEMDLLPKHMCHRCSYKLEEFHKFYMDCLKTDADLKSQLSWMRKEDSNERIGVPMVHIENVKIKLEPPDYDVYEMSPIVNDVKYINSMSSVSFPVNGVQPNDISDGITYTAYTGCSCYCDKTDQSNQTVCANYKNTIPRCNRLKNVRSGNDRRSNDLQAVKKDVLPNESCKKRTNLPTLINEVKNMKRDISSVNENISKGSIVRNLRPRKGFIDYSGTNRMHPVISSKNSDRSKDATTKMSTPLTELSIAQIKIEKLDHVEGRILRPRKGTIDYMGPRRRKCTNSIDKNQRSPGDKYRSVNEHKVRNIANKLKVPTSTMPMLLENTIKLAIKQEHLSDPEDTLVFRESVSTILSKNHEDSNICLVNKMDSLPNDCITNVQNDRVDSSTLKQEQYDDNYSVTNQWKSVNKLRKIDLDQISTTDYSSKYLRNQNLYLRSGRIKELDNRKLSPRLLRSLRSVIDSGKGVERNLTKTVQGETRTRKMSASNSASLIDNIKHYCEECNISFVNRELFKLHTCYR